MATADFTDRCSAAGAFFCQGFDEDVPPGRELPEGTGMSSDGLRPVVHDGVIRMAYPDLSGQSAAGLYIYDIEANHGFEIGPGESLFVQFRYRQSRALAASGCCPS